MRTGVLSGARQKRIAALADLHCPRTGEDVLRALFNQVAAEADVILLCGDLTDYGKPEEARSLAQALAYEKRKRDAERDSKSGDCSIW